MTLKSFVVFNPAHLVESVSGILQSLENQEKFNIEEEKTAIATFRDAYRKPATTRLTSR